VIFPPELLDQIALLTAAPWEGEVWRHMFGDLPPTRENSRGARWNPPDVHAIYTSLGREVAKAEGDYIVSMQPIPVRARRVLHRMKVRLESVVDARSLEALAPLGITPDDLVDMTHRQCRLVGGAVEFLGHDGLLVPSARSSGVNLVIYPANCHIDGLIEPIESVDV
jgi:RES domain-containing protein